MSLSRGGRRSLGLLVPMASGSIHPSSIRSLHMSVLSFMAKRLRDGGRRKRMTVRRPPRRRLAMEALDDRIMLSITEFPIPAADSNPFGITRGPDGNLWFTESLAGRIGRITPAGVVTEFSAGITPGGQPAEITAGPDGNLWFTEQFPHPTRRLTPPRH